MPDLDPREAYERALGQTESIITAVRSDQLGDPTPCDEFDVRALVEHVVGGIGKAALVAEGARGEPGSPDPAGPDGAATAEDLLARFRQARSRAGAAWADDALLDTMVEVPWGKVPGRGAIGGFTMEVLIHGWDLAKATGQPTEGDQELGRLMLEAARQMLPEQPRGGEIPFGPVVPTPPDAGVYAQLAGWLGRQP